MRGDAGRALGQRALRRHCTFVMIWLRRRSWRCRVSGRAARRVCVGTTRRSRCGDVATGECVATLEGHSDWRALRRPLYFCDDVCFVVGQWRCRVSGRAARRVWVGRQDAQGVGRGGGNAWRLEGHSWDVRCGVRCTFVMIWLRRSLPLRCRISGRAARRVWVKRLQDAQGVGRGDRRMRGDAGICHSARALRGVRCTFVMMCLRRRSIALPCFRTGGASCLCRGRQTLKVWDVATGKCVATLEGHSGRALRRPLYL